MAEEHQIRDSANSVATVYRFSPAPQPAPQYQHDFHSGAFGLSSTGFAMAMSSGFGSSSSRFDAAVSTRFGSNSSGFGKSALFGSISRMAPDSGMRAFGVSKMTMPKKASRPGSFAIAAGLRPPPHPASTRARSSPSQFFSDGVYCFGSAVADVHAEAPVTSNTPDEEKLHQIVMLQSSSGMFPSTLALAHQIGFHSLISLNANLPAALNVSAEIWMTALVCVFLEKKLENEKDAWELVVEKAWAYIVSVTDATKVVEIEAAAAEAISV